MIRVNLLAPERATKKKTGGGPALPSGGTLQSYLLLALFAGGAAVLCAGAWWLQSNKIKDLDTRIAADTKRRQDLQAIEQQVKAFQQKKATLENKVAVIEMLRAAQKSPVHMLDEVSQALPDYVWLTQMDETRGSVVFGGQSNSLAAVADFISALQTSGWFPVVELVSSQEANALVTFNLRGNFNDPEVAAKQKAAAEAAAAAGVAPAQGGR
ncbi:MAG: PilN domain-containing protein [Acidobacteriota bacterium]|jgi:type IV pilus assembly protein PilN|nr:PilN domain-containing protein [Acidobacteriota bacterium]